MRFEAGHPKYGGRRAGTTNRATAQVRQLAQKLFDEAYWAAVSEQLHQRTLHPMIEKTLLAYAYGEPKQIVEVQTGDGQVDKAGLLKVLPDEVLATVAAHAQLLEDSDGEPVN